MQHVACRPLLSYESVRSCIRVYASLRDTSNKGFSHLFQKHCRPYQKPFTDVIGDLESHDLYLSFEGQRFKFWYLDKFIRCSRKRKRWESRQTLPLPLNMKLYIGSRLAYLHLNWPIPKIKAKFANLCTENI